MRNSVILFSATALLACGGRSSLDDEEPPATPIGSRLDGGRDARAADQTADALAPSDAGLKRWRVLGDPSAVSSFEWPALAVDSTGTPWLAFRMSAGGGPRQAGVARWHGANWAIVRTFPGEVPLPCDGDFAIDEHDDVFVYLASSADSSKLGQARVAVRQESAWWDLGQPFPSLSGQRVDPCPRLAVSRAGTPWAAVSTSSNGTDGFITYVSRWTGASWQTNPFPFVAKASGDGSARQGIWLAGLIVDGSGAPVVALEQRELDTLTTKVERWTGAQWQELGRLTKDSYPLAVSRSGAPVIVTSVSTGLQVLEWDGSTWQPIGGPIPLSRHVLAPAIAFDEADRPIVAFVQAPPEEGSYVCLHRWSGSAWERIPAPLNPTPSNPISEPFSLAVSQNGTIFLAFTQPDFTVEQYGPEP